MQLQGITRSMVAVS